MNRLIWTPVLLLLSCVSLSAQWFDYRAPGISRTPDGKPNLSAPAPRTPDGKPDFSGIWRAENPGLFLNLSKGVEGGVIPYRPEVMNLVKTRRDDSNSAVRSTEPSTNCLPRGPAMPFTWGEGPRKLVQTPGLLVLLIEYNISFRQIFLDGRPLPTDSQPAWDGYSVGRWDGDALVVEQTGFKDGQWLDAAGDPLTDAAKVTQRFRRPDFGHLQIEMTVDDPKAYTKPWTVKINEIAEPDTDLLEFVCKENEKDVQHIKAAAGAK
jgi:hypothetical protein